MLFTTLLSGHAVRCTTVIFSIRHPDHVLEQQLKFYYQNYMLGVKTNQHQLEERGHEFEREQGRYMGSSWWKNRNEEIA